MGEQQQVQKQQTETTTETSTTTSTISTPSRSLKNRFLRVAKQRIKADGFLRGHVLNTTFAVAIGFLYSYASMSAAEPAAVTYAYSFLGVFVGICLGSLFAAYRGYFDHAFDGVLSTSIVTIGLLLLLTPLFIVTTSPAAVLPGLLLVLGVVTVSIVISKPYIGLGKQLQNLE